MFFFVIFQSNNNEGMSIYPKYSHLLNKARKEKKYAKINDHHIVMLLLLILIAVIIESIY